MVAPAAVAVAFVVTRMGRESMAARGVLAVSVTWLRIVSLFGQIHNRYSNNALTPFTFGQLDRDGLLRVGVNYYETVEEANRVVPPGSRIVFLGGDESFYLARGRICNSIYDRSELGRLADQAADARDMLDQLGRRRITHLIVNEPRCEEYASAGYGMFEWSEKAKKVFLDMWATYGRLVFVSHGVFLFELSSRPIPTAERKTGYPSYFHPPEVVQKSRDTVAAIDRAVGKGDNEDTYRLAEELVRMVPGMAHAWAYRGYANSSLHRRKAAIADYQRAIKVGYPTGVVYHNLALLLEEEKRYPEALISYLGAIRLEGNIGRALPRAADIALGLGRIPLALQLAERAFEANPADPEAKTRVEKIRQLAGVRGR
jgi:tetratricopeptide (TPR) repeat protein